MTDKNVARILFKSVRNGIEKNQKINFDYSIACRLINSELFGQSDLILTYVSHSSEADTVNIIKYALSIGKRVAVPYCTGNDMIFFEISDFNELIEGRFGIYTVNPGNNLPVYEFDNALCIVPGLGFSPDGKRLGYGGGFYDRFLSDNKISTVALTYERCISDQIPVDKNDIPMNYILTEHSLYKALNKEVNTYE